MKLNKTRVFIQGPGWHPYASMFLDEGDFIGVRKIEDADLVCFTGGADVDPSLYDETIIRGTTVDVKRDQDDTMTYWEAAALGLPMVGICRGGQFLNVMNGGAMWQDVTNHTASHWIYDMVTKDKIHVTSTHHQMMIPSVEGDVVAYACTYASDSLDSLCQYKKSAKVTMLKSEGDELGSDVEVVWYPGTHSLCYQPHPEMEHMQNHPHRKYFFSLLERYKMTVETDAA